MAFQHITPDLIESSLRSMLAKATPAIEPNVLVHHLPHFKDTLQADLLSYATGLYRACGRGTL